MLIVVLLLSLVLWIASPAATLKVKPKTMIDAAGKVQVVEPGYTIQENKFMRLANLVPSVLTVMTWLAIMAIGETVVIIAGGIDISVGSIMGLSAFVTAWALQGPAKLQDDGTYIWYGYDWLYWSQDAAGVMTWHGWLGDHGPAWLHFLVTAPWAGAVLGVLIAMSVGAICGLLNGVTVVGLRMHPFIVTLATLSVFRWMALKIGYLLDNQMSLPWGDRLVATGFSDKFIAYQYQRSRFDGRLMEYYQFVPVIIMIFCLILGWVYLRHTVWGRQTYAVGGNEEAARFSGIPIPWVKIRVYLISGLCAGIGGLLICGISKSASTTYGTGDELTVVAAAVVGGASLSGGRGTALGAVLGMLVLTLVEDGISVLEKINLGLFSFRVEKQDQKLINGLAIVIAVAVDNLSTYFSRRRLARSSSH